jgi:hypothetical protein
MRAESPAALSLEEPGTACSGPAPARLGLRDLLLLLALTAGAVLIHGYHPFAEDAEIYLPGVKKLLQPSLYPLNAGFFSSHASMTLFPNLIAISVRASHLGLEWALLLWHLALIFSLLAAAWKLGATGFGSRRAAWGSALLVAALLTIPVAGTALYIMDQYVNPRSFSTASALWVMLFLVRQKHLAALALILSTALIHPLMALFSLAFAGVFLWRRTNRGFVEKPCLAALPAVAIVPATLFGPIGNAYRQALDSRPYFFPLRWAWYEWLGVCGPLLILSWLARMARLRRLAAIERLASTAVVFGAGSVVIALLITIPVGFRRLIELQPMRSLEIVYLVLMVISGGLIGERLLDGKWWRWLAFFVPLGLGMFYSQRQLFAGSAHVEWPGKASGNAWVRAFLWIRQSTPIDGYFALDPDHMRLPGEDQQGFRAIAERSMLADRVKDSGAAAMFPALAPAWLDQTSAEAGWKRFERQDFERLHEKYGVDWAVVAQPGVAGLSCPYSNRELLVCRIDQGARRTPGKLE